jgi:hypothetical protein
LRRSRFSAASWARERKIDRRYVRSGDEGKDRSDHVTRSYGPRVAAVGHWFRPADRTICGGQALLLLIRGWHSREIGVEYVLDDLP